MGSMLWNGVSNHPHNIIPEMDGKSSAVFCAEDLRMAPTPKIVMQPWTWGLRQGAESGRAQRMSGLIGFKELFRVLVRLARRGVQ